MRISKSTVSNAFEKSAITASVTSPLSMALTMSSFIMMHDEDGAMSFTKARLVF